MLNVGSIIEGPFRLIRERPVAVAVWGLLHLAVVIASFLAVRPMQATFLSGNPQVMPNIWAMFGRLIPLYLLSLIVWTVTLAAAQRAILRPERSGFFHLRFGMDELRMAVLALLLVILSYAALIALIGVIGVVVVTLGAAMALGVKTIAVALVALGLVILFIWVEVRLSLAFPLTLLRRRIVIGESWRLTRGRFWTLFGAYFALFLIMMAVWVAAASVSSASYLTDLASGGFNPAGMNRAAQAQIARQAGGIDPLMVFGWLIAAAAAAIGTAVGGGAVATAARELAANREEIADTFA